MTQLRIGTDGDSDDYSDPESDADGDAFDAFDNDL